MQAALPGYEYVERIAVGGMTEIFLAWQTGAGGFRRQVAVKHILPRPEEDPEFPALFMREATIATSLSHPNIVSVLDVPASAGGGIIVMEYVCGRSLRHLLQVMHQDSLRIPNRVASYVAASVCDALDHAYHAAGPLGEPLQIVHSDISPSKILVDINGRVKLTDFRIGSCGWRPIPRTGGVRGSIAYMSPEQARGEALDPRSDLFSLGAVLYEMTTGIRPFAGDGAATAEAVLAGELTPPSRWVSDVDPVIERIIMCALAIDRGCRYPLSALMADDLRSVAGYDAQLAAAELATILRKRFPELARRGSGRPDRPNRESLGGGSRTVVVTRSRRTLQTASPELTDTRSRLAFWLAVATLVSALLWTVLIVAAAA